MVDLEEYWVKQKLEELALEFPEFRVAFEFPLEVEQALEYLYMDDQPHPFVFHDHWRGRSCHLDHRWLKGTKPGTSLNGFTVAHQKKGIAKEPVRTLEQARKLMKDDKNWKISNEPGPLRMFATPKKPEPYEWLTYEGVVEPREVRPGAPGSTRFEWGVFLIRDKGVQYYGAQKPYFREFFLKGRKYDGRWIYRMIPRRKPADRPEAVLFLFGKPKDQLPYVLSSRAVKDEWIPPHGVSCLPPDIKKLIPKDLQFWKERNRSKRLEIREKLREALKKKKLKIKLEEGSFVLQWQFFRKKGKKPVRAGPTTEHWHLWIKTPKKLMRFVLVEDPTSVNHPITAIEKSASESHWMNKEGLVKPGTSFNPTKETLSWLYIQDKGPVEIFEDSIMFKKFRFKGRKLKGVFTLEREAKGQALFIFQKSSLPST